MQSNRRKWIWILFLLYSAVMLWLLLHPGRTSGHPANWLEMGWHFNRHPFRTIRSYWRYILHPKSPAYFRAGFTNLVGNIVLFIPLGFFPSLLFPALNRVWRTLGAVLVLMTLIEFLQMILLVGTFDIGDLLLNLTGAALGYGVYRIFRKQ